MKYNFAVSLKNLFAWCKCFFLVDFCLFLRNIYNFNSLGEAENLCLCAEGSSPMFFPHQVLFGFTACDVSLRFFAIFICIAANTELIVELIFIFNFVGLLFISLVVVLLNA